MQRGRQAREQVLGAQQVAANPAREDDFSKPFSDLLLEFCWGTVWADDALPKRTRSLINIAVLAAMNRQPQLRTHLKAAVNNGCTLEEIQAVLIQVSVYCGIPAGAEAFRQARETLDLDLDLDPDLDLDREP